jgi:hypothetical protein
MMGIAKANLYKYIEAEREAKSKPQVSVQTPPLVQQGKHERESIFAWNHPGVFHSDSRNCRRIFWVLNPNGGPIGV